MDDKDKPEELESGSFIDDDDYSDDDDQVSQSDDDDVNLKHQEPLTEEEIEELIGELLEVESKAAEAQESLEDETLAKVEAEVREELKQSYKGDELEKAVRDEIEALKGEWETVLDDLETDSAHLLEQLEGAGIELPSLYKWIESQAPSSCSTETWRKRTHWVGSRVTDDVTEIIADAEKYLQIHRPVRKKLGKVLEEGASGFLEKKISSCDGIEGLEKTSDVDWSSFNKIISSSDKSTLFGSSQWASVYLASTPQQAAELGIKFPGVDEVEEIEDLEGSSDFLIFDAIVSENINLTAEQRKNYKKVKEEEDVYADRKLQLRLKRRRQRNRCKQEVIPEAVPSCNRLIERSVDDFETRQAASSENFIKVDVTSETDIFCKTALLEVHEARGSKRPRDNDGLSSDLLNTDDVSNMLNEHIQQNLQGEECSSGLVISHGMQSLKGDFLCTACHKVAIEVHPHPLLDVIICRDCKSLLEAKNCVKDPECSECYCEWCGQKSNLISCNSCKLLICSTCIKRNLGEKCLFEAEEFGWTCCCCSPSILQELTSQFEQAIISRDLMVSSSDGDEDGNAVIRKRRKKRIRRIIDDTELGEETKMKIAIEKERQDRLNSLKAQFSSKSKLASSVGFNVDISESCAAEVLGDALTGYIVNVVREEGEEAVRIPPSISSKLKAHQVSGIRFMWENIIQSIGKARSGDKGLGCILAHTMGLGKTFQVITFLYSAMRSVDVGLKTALIVTPVNVLHNWRHEFIKWRPSELKPLCIFMLEDVTREKRAKLLMKWKRKGGVFLIGYTSFRNLSLGKHIKDRDMARDILHALQDGPDILVCDEAHMIKNTRADVTQTLKQVKCQRRIALTGSPLQNNLMEYYCMVDFVREGFLGSSHEFRNRYQNPIVNGQHTNSTADDVKIMNQRSHILYEQLKGFVQRMDMNVVKKDLPPKTVVVIAVKLSPLQRKLYKRFLDVHGFTKGKVSAEKTRKSFFAGYQALAQIWNHPRILQLMQENKEYEKHEVIENFLAGDSFSDEDLDHNINGEQMRNEKDHLQKKSPNGFFAENWWGDLLKNNHKDAEYSGKMVLLLDVLSMSSEIGDKVLIFSQSLATLDLIELYLSKLIRPKKEGKCWKKGKDWYRLDGRTQGSERQKLVDRFNEPSNKRVKCTLISTRAGSLGINLQAANRVIIVDGSWNPTHDLQAIYRVWRYGQTKPVYAYRLLAHGTMEEKIYKRQVTKESLAARVVDRQQVHRTISKEEMLHLFDFSDDEHSEMLPELNQINNNQTKRSTNPDDDSSPKQAASISSGNVSADKVMESLLSNHRPRWIANYHEHESLLQENEDERLSKEEQDMAWEMYRRSIEWEEVHQVPFTGFMVGQKAASHVPSDELTLQQNSAVSGVPIPEPQSNKLSVLNQDAAISDIPLPEHQSSRNFQPKRVSLFRSFRSIPMKCTNLSHLLTLRSQGATKGGSIVCGGCAQEICYDNSHSS
ncbi:protein CHROMATIN REMODELING 20 [Daucus carota subsp. sativus]|uniref:protein CHROMATIN REMODELING 20 n=1 Tax=Daucus carota subsp. sativus TaxID=79200 RepID=UPI0007EF012E|nr:PREDICTED: protein CHROMATIN REMODELING 20 [Daucus carota subsp. sativus]